MALGRRSGGHEALLPYRLPALGPLLTSRAASYESPRISLGSTPRERHQRSYSIGEISDGLISLRPPHKTFVYVTGIPASARCSSIARLCASRRSLSSACATPMTFTLLNSGPASRQYACVMISCRPTSWPASSSRPGGTDQWNSAL